MKQPINATVDLSVAYHDDLSHLTDSELEKQRKRSKMTALGIAVLAHVIILVIALLVIVAESLNEPPAITITGGDDPSSMALTKKQVNQRVRRASASSASAIPTITTNVAANLAIPEVTDFSPDALDLGTMGIGNGFGFNAMGTNFSGAEFLGLKGGGKRILLVIDTSGSMPQVCKPEGIAAIRKEIAKTINGLPDQTEFNLVCYANDADLFAEEPVRATASNKKAALKFMEGYFGAGSFGKTRTMTYKTKGKDKEGIAYVPVPPDSIPELKGTGGGSRIDLGLIAAFKQKPSAVFILSDGAPTTTLKGKRLDQRDIINFIDDVYDDIYGAGGAPAIVNSVSINGLGEDFLKDISRKFKGKHKDIRPDKL